ncbi:hypothetical protein BEN47_10880 [Hymenobacter lapidarius]|uniref:Uncharacterized protein n=1 Tax=Hymenobacter lapidarius TaxID=1908237 RepID=A0A1G1T990_9BACT|nr:hypothetical protein [Hymenobacter lapidarius]OGX87424.1 hypothetical protein BEN47_10880 [Hymenobacter lapidarius]
MGINYFAASLCALALGQAVSLSSFAQKTQPANTAAVRVNGQVFAVVPAASSAVLDRKTNELLVTLNAANGARVVVRLAEFRRRPERFVVTDPRSFSGVYYTAVTDGRAQYFDFRNCANPNRMIDVIGFDSVRHTVSGTFSGTACGSGSNRNRAIPVTSGTFNLHYSSR